MHYWSILQFLILLTLANGSPVVAKRLFGGRFAQPLDGNLQFLDGRPIFGRSKTIRGIVVSIVTTSACAPLLGIELKTGVGIALVSMAGDLFSSFIKRRIGMSQSSQAVGLDQIPESLFPLLAFREVLLLTAVDIFVIAAIFFVGEVLLSRLLFKFHVRDRPY